MRARAPVLQRAERAWGPAARTLHERAAAARLMLAGSARYAPPLPRCLGCVVDVGRTGSACGLPAHASTQHERCRGREPLVGLWKISAGFAA